MSDSAVMLHMRTTSETETRKIAQTLSRNLQPGDLVALQGELGAGKTCFVRGMAEGMGIEPSQVASPTFVIAHEYESRDRNAALVHIDAYRLSGADELESIGWNEILQSRDAVIAVEWPDKIASALPRERIDVQIRTVAQTERAIRISAPAKLADRLASLEGISHSQAEPQQAKCRTCGRAFDASARTFPFCSDRCRMADLGAWFHGSYRTSRPVERDEELGE